MFRFFLLPGIVSMLFLMSGCNDTPNSVGVGIQNKEDFGVVHVDTFYATGHTSLPNHLYTSTLDRFMLGKYESSSGPAYQAWTCMKFYNWPDSMIGIGSRITSAWIQLKGVYRFGSNPSAPLTFNVYKALASLGNDSLSYDSLALNSRFYFEASPIFTVTPDNLGDTASYIIPFQKLSLVADWFSTNTDTSHLNDGLIFQPTSSNIIKGFYSFNNADTSLQPTLFVMYNDTNGVSRIYSHKTGGAKYVSTVSQLITDNNFMYVQDGVSTRGVVSFDSIPIKWPVSILRTVLEVVAQPSVPVLHDSLYALSVAPTGLSDGASYAISQTATDSSGRHHYSIDIRAIAIRWLSNASVRKVAVSGFFEGGSFDLFRLYGTGALKPRVIITYSTQP
ncbi:MAG: hypothetical protein EHM64_12300 [Ignavibacteriae bacterium]|nr:MAG: hypothetical protein EHM64_12300 [Ignavibacteriota bacterium]